MLMPSALSCDSSQPPRTRLQAAFFASPPSSPSPASAQNAIGNIFSTCRALQSMLSGPVAPEDAQLSSSPAQLPTPPMAHAALPPLKLRLRSRKSENNNDLAARKKVVKRSAAPPRGQNKRRRNLDDDMGRDDESSSDLEGETSDRDAEADAEPPYARPSTPKRARIAPEVLPLGLERSDFHQLHSNGVNYDAQTEGTDAQVEGDGETWSAEEDRMLVELVLEKLKLSKTDWQECARSLGKDRSSLGRRWKSLMCNGEVGLKSRSRRSKIHGTWR